MIRPDDLAGLLANGSDRAETWMNLPHLHQAFKGLNQDAAAFQQYADALTQTIKDLTKLHPVDEF